MNLLMNVLLSPWVLSLFLSGRAFMSLVRNTSFVSKWFGMVVGLSFDRVICSSETWWWSVILGANISPSLVDRNHWPLDVILFLFVFLGHSRSYFDWMFVFRVLVRIFIPRLESISCGCTIQVSGDVERLKGLVWNMSIFIALSNSRRFV